MRGPFGAVASGAASALTRKARAPAGGVDEPFEQSEATIDRGANIEPASVRAGTLLPGIHGLRCLAAFAIVVFHLDGIGHIVPAEFSGVNTHGSHAVKLFFLISAFSLMYATAPTQGHPNWLFNYSVRRLFRIAPLFYVMIIPSAWFQYWLLGAPIRWTDLPFNLLFIFNFFPSKMPSMVQAGWTIGVEMIAYAFLPLIVIAVRTLRAAAILLIVSVVIGHFAATMNWSPDLPWWTRHFNFLNNLQWFSAGVFGYFCFSFLSNADEKRHLVGPICLAICVVAGVIVVAFPNYLSQRLGLLSFLTSLCVWQALSPSRILANRTAVYFGERSYSIYLLHTPIIILLWPVYAQIAASLGSGLGYFVSAPLTFVVVLPAAEITYRLIERPGIHLGRYIIRRPWAPSP